MGEMQREKGGKEPGTEAGVAEGKKAEVRGNRAEEEEKEEEGRGTGRGRRQTEASLSLSNPPPLPWERSSRGEGREGKRGGGGVEAEGGTLRYFWLVCLVFMSSQTRSSRMRRTTSRASLRLARVLARAVPKEPPPKTTTFFVEARTESESWPRCFARDHLTSDCHASEMEWRTWIDCLEGGGGRGWEGSGQWLRCALIRSAGRKLERGDRGGMRGKGKSERR